MIGAVALLISRGLTPLTTNVYAESHNYSDSFHLRLGLRSQVQFLKVGIKKFTTMKQSTLAFGLFYTLMNVGFAIGAEIADYFRDLYGDGGGTELLGIEFTTYQIIILVGFVLNIPDFIAIIMMRDGAEILTENGLTILKVEENSDLKVTLGNTKEERKESR